MKNFVQSASCLQIIWLHRHRHSDVILLKPCTLEHPYVTASRQLFRCVMAVAQSYSLYRHELL